ncbi:MAG: LysM peptidoglycan-binding domain-containing protein [Verrucomicrobiota bacterium]|jgi:LysM repeat protein|nr:LysM peptidoglycan-binding domain-containing protein [Verrucomicrobiota bacterium]MDP7049528.1 LysM peptidoglycan-binding domain-containing protein [Verrucomicrobiota bacterium]
MSSHNPLRPKSSLLEQKAKNRSGLQMVMIIVAVHVVFLGGLLFSGCRPDQAPPATVAETNSIPSLPPIGGEVATLPADTNTVTVVEPPGSAAPPLPESTTTGDDPKPPPVTREPETAVDIVPLVPEPSNEPEVPVSSGETEYVVAKGDTFTTIARKHGVTVQAVIKANPAVDPTRMAIGQVLIIPAKPPELAKPALPEGTTEYLVKAGDNLYNIAKAHNTTWKAIREASNLNTTAIRVGQKLIIPPPASDE